MMKIIIILISILLLSSCSSDEDINNAEPNKQHIFSDKKAALEKSKQVEQLIQEGFNKNAQKIEEQIK